MNIITTNISHFFYGHILFPHHYGVDLPSCYSLTSFNYGAKKEMDVSLTCRSHLGIIVPDSIFYDSMLLERG